MELHPASSQQNDTLAAEARWADLRRLSDTRNPFQKFAKEEHSDEALSMIAPGRSWELAVQHYSLAIECGTHAQVTRAHALRACLSASRGPSTNQATQCYLDEEGAKRTAASPRLERWLRHAAKTREMFWLATIGAESIIDSDQRLLLKTADRCHPLLQRMLGVHIQDEASHVRFGEYLFEKLVVDLPAPRRSLLARATPTLIRGLAESLLRVDVADRCLNAPQAVINETYGSGSPYEQHIKTVTARIVEVVTRLRLLEK